MSNLKSCPFCGENDCLYWTFGIGAGANCLTRDGRDAREAWNTRPIEDALLARAEKAEAKLARVCKALITASEILDEAVGLYEEGGEE